MVPDTQEGFMVFVERRNAVTLEAHIEDNIVPGTIIHSDGWAGYSGYVIKSRLEFFCVTCTGFLPSL